MTGSAVLVWPAAAVVRGPAIVRQLLAVQPGLAGARISWQPLHVEVAADGSLGLIWGVIALDRDTGVARTPSPRLGRFLAAWRRGGAAWKIEALAVNGVVPAAEARWLEGLGPVDLPALRSTGPAGRFVAADSIFAARAGVKGAAVAFPEWAAPDAVTFAASGELNVGPMRIGAALAGDASDWKWGRSPPERQATGHSAGRWGRRPSPREHQWRHGCLQRKVPHPLAPSAWRHHSLHRRRRQRSPLALRGSSRPASGGTAQMARPPASMAESSSLFFHCIWKSRA